MQGLERVVNVLCGFADGRTELPLNELLGRLGIPQSSGYKLVSALVAEGFLQRPSRGRVALGPAATAFFFAPLKASSPAQHNAIEGRSGTRSRSISRTTKWNPNLLDLVSTEKFRSEPPFVIGFANASSSSPWRVAMAGSLIAAAQRQRVVSRIVVRDAKDDPALQVEQLAQMEADGIDLCILSAATGDDDALNAAVRSMARRGMPIIGVDRMCGDAADITSFVTASDVLVGRMSALWLVERLGGRGRILMLCGREDASPCQLRLQAAMEILNLHPDVEVIAVEYTGWLAQSGYEIVRRYLAAGVVPDGVWCDSGLQGVGSLRAFNEAGFKRGTTPPHTGGEINLMYKLAFTGRVPLCGVDYPASMGALAFQTAIDTLFGRQVPRRMEANLEIVISRGHETQSVKADFYVEERVRWDRADDYVHASGWIPSRTANQKKPVIT